jgi:hypothetical protein
VVGVNPGTGVPVAPVSPVTKAVTSADSAQEVRGFQPDGNFRQLASVGDTDAIPDSAQDIQFYLDQDMLGTVSDVVRGWIDSGQIDRASQQIEQLKTQGSTRSTILASELEEYLQKKSFAPDLSSLDAGLLSY